MEKRPLNIILTGPESSGKTTLAKQLAFHFNRPWHAEIARTYLSQINRPYTETDVLTIAKVQLDLLNALNKKKATIHILDTSLLVLKIWLKEKYNKTVTWLDGAIETSTNDLYILCKPDIPWESDPLRENALDRDRLFDIYEKYLKKMGKEYVVVSGNLEERLELVLENVDVLLG